jgi:hypothetical protein
MSAEANGNHSSASTWVAGAALAVILYLLAPGLLAYLDAHSTPAPTPDWVDKVMSIVYAPLRASMRFEPVREAYSAYLSWCCGKAVSIPAPPP